jgi:WD40 repeat protein
LPAKNEKLAIPNPGLEKVVQFCLTFPSGLLIEKNSQLPEGYSLSYTNLARTGMSGGAILDAQGKLIGINGIVRLADNSEDIIASGIEIETFLEWRLRQSRPFSRQQTILSSSLSPLPQTTSGFTLLQSLSLDKGIVNSIAINPLADSFVTGTSRGILAYWHLESGKNIAIFPESHDASVNAIAIISDQESNQEILASGSDDKTIKIWSLPSGKLIRTFQGHNDSVTSLAVSWNRQILASGSWDKTVKLWQLNSGKLIHTLTGHSQIVNAVAISPDGKIIASGSQDTTIRLWDLTSGRLLHILSGNSLGVLSLVISADGKTLVSGSSDGKINIWNLDTGQLINTLTGHTDGVWSLAIAPDDRTIFSSSWDKTIKIWDLKTAKLLDTLSEHTAYISSLAISSNGQTLISGDWDSQLYLWRKK